jgi:dipeptide/tripeptide permease
VIGALISFTVVAYLCQNVSFSSGYTIPAAAMIVATIVFWLGRHRYLICHDRPAARTHRVRCLYDDLDINVSHQ